MTEGSWEADAFKGIQIINELLRVQEAKGDSITSAFLTSALRQLEEAVANGDEQTAQAIISHLPSNDGDEYNLVEVSGASFESPNHGSFAQYAEKEEQLKKQPTSTKTESQSQTSSAAQSAHPKTSDSPAQHVIEQAIKGEYSYGKLALALGLSSIIGGVILGLHGVAGGTSWTAKFLGLQSTINDAAPGVILFVVGLFMIYVTRPKVRLRDLRDR